MRQERKMPVRIIGVFFFFNGLPSKILAGILLDLIHTTRWQ